MKQFILFILITQSVLSQKPIDPNHIKAFNIIVNYSDYTVKTQMLKNSKQVPVNNELCYLWYNSNKITETRGGYDGRLLHGYYKSFYAANNQLKEYGQVKYGLKNGEWKYWYADGKLKEIITWKKGRKNGKYILFNDYGEKMAKGNFKRDVLHGHFYTYNNYGKVLETKKYKKGNEVLKAPKKVNEKKVKTPRKTKKDKSENIEKSKKEKKKLGIRIKNVFKKKEKSKTEK